jgi:hypothetical protein
MDLEQFAALDEVADRHRLGAERLRLATTPGLVPILLQLDKLGQASDQSGEFLRLVIGQPLVREAEGVRRLSVHIGQRQAIVIDDTIASGDWLKSPWRRKTALGHRTSIKCV